MEIVIIGVVIVVAYAVIMAAARSQAKAAYESSLAQLRSNPSDAGLRQRTLTLGRTYSNATRNNKGVTIFDEMALMNDINAACGGTAVAHGDSFRPVPAPVALPSANASPLEDRLMRLTKLKEQGLVNDEEYQSKRQQLLSEV